MAGPSVNLINGTVTQSIFGGGYGVGAVVTGNPEVNVTGGSAANIYGGGALADVLGNTSVVISGGASGDVYGGGLSIVLQKFLPNSEYSQAVRIIT